MSAPDKILSQAEAFLAEIPQLSRPVISAYFRKNFDVDTKADESPVTIADKQTEQAIRAGLAEHFPEHDIIGEEQGGEAHTRYCWVIDPIDGTRAFVVGRPLFGTLVGFMDSGKAVAGLIDMPALEESYHSQNGKAWLTDRYGRRQITSSSCTELHQAHIATTSPDAFSAEGWKLFETISAKARGRHYGGDCYNYALVAAGHLDCVMEHQLAVHDIAGLIAVLEAAGAVVSDWAGQPVTMNSDGSLLVSATAELHEQMLHEIALHQRG